MQKKEKRPVWMTLLGCWGVPPMSSLRSELARDIHDIETESGLKDAKYQQQQKNNKLQHITAKK